MALQDCWHDRRVLVTGHTGFKGSWLSLWLQRMGAQLTGYALDPPTAPSLFDLAAIGSGMRDVRGDVRDLNAVSEAVGQAQPEVIFHLAAQPLVRYSYTHPVETYATNVMGTVHVLEAARNCPSVKAVLIITSDKCYENREWVWGYRESEAMGGADPYSSSKGCAELVTAAYRNLVTAGGDSQLLVGSARAGNVVGGGDWAEDRLIPDMMKAFLAGETVLIRCPGAVRPWQHVLEPVHGYLMLAAKLLQQEERFGEGWNFGPGVDSARPVLDVVSLLADSWGEGANWRIDDRAHPPEAHFLRLDSTKARTGLGWQPVLNLDATLRWVAEWYRAYGASEDMRAVTDQQLDNYQKLLNHEPS